MGRRKVRNVPGGLGEVGGLEPGEKGLEGGRVTDTVARKKQLRGLGSVRGCHMEKD